MISSPIVFIRRVGALRREMKQHSGMKEHDIWSHIDLTLGPGLIILFICVTLGK